MRLFWNQRQIPSAARILFNERPVKRVFFNRIQVWLRAALVRNQVTEEKELSYTWNDAGTDSRAHTIWQGRFEPGRWYYVRTEYRCWGYAYGGEYTARLELQLGGTALAAKTADGSHDTGLTAVQSLFAGTGTATALTAAVQRSASSQGNMSTEHTMVADVTELYEAGFTTEEAVWEKLGFFRGEKLIEF